MVLEKTCDLLELKTPEYPANPGRFHTIANLAKNVKFNGSRSTKFDSLEEKLAYFSESHDDCYFLLAKNKPFNKKYRLVIFNSSVCNVSQLDWMETASGKEWRGEGKFVASIGKAMSAQLWTTLPIENVDFMQEIDCGPPKEEPLDLI